MYTDLEAMERVLRESDLDRTAVRPPRLTDRPGRGRHRHAVESGPAGATVPRADVARAMLDLVTDTPSASAPDPTADRRRTVHDSSTDVSDRWS